MIDEFHLVSNVAKYMIEMISPRYNAPYRYIGNDQLYPFTLSNAAIDAMRDAVNNSKHLIPSNGFKGSFIGFDPRNSKSIYRSSDYIDFLLYNLVLYCPLFEDTAAGDCIACLIRGISLSLQFSISTQDLREMDL